METQKSGERRHPFNQPPRLGMERFYTDENLQRYRHLASATTSAEERRRIILALAVEAMALKDKSPADRDQWRAG